MASNLTQSWRSVNEAGTTFHLIKRLTIVSTLVASTFGIWHYMKKKRNDLPKEQKIFITLGGMGYAMQVAFKLLYAQTSRPCPNGETIGAVAAFPLLYLLPAAYAKPSTNKYNATTSRLVYLFGSISFCLGIYIQAMSEYQRKIFKEDPANKGKLYTEGWNAITRNPNYFAEILVFAGWSMFAFNKSVTFWTPAVMTLLFYTYHIPEKEEYLSIKYKDEWDGYAQNVKALIPYLY